MFHEIPTTRPDTPLLDRTNLPRDLRALETGELPQLATELRHFLLYTVGRTGGHFGAGLGVVELTIALHYCFETPRDKLIWDVGHQTYPHKILTGRRDAMATLRQKGGLAPFPSREESEYDVFGVGHSSTSISAALGFALADSTGEAQTVVVIGDGAMTAGMAFEALNHVAATRANMLIVLNDNAMSISENVGGLANYFARNISAKDLSGDPITSNSPPGSIFRDLGFHYTGPIDGHNLDDLLANLRQLQKVQGPRILHIITTKGKGYSPAESAPVKSHALTKLEKQHEKKQKTYSNIFGEWLTEKAAHDARLIAITPAMKEGSDLVSFADRFPDRFHDVAIAEQHAVTLAAGLAAGGAKPVIAIYSTFLQRAFDQLIHDVALQNLDVLFAVDRASLLEDGPTHSGVFDLAFARSIPNITLMTPASEEELKLMLEAGYEHQGPCVVRYPRGGAVHSGGKIPPVRIGLAEVLSRGSRVAILSFGSMVAPCRIVAEKNGFTLVNMRFVKPMDLRLISDMAQAHELIVTCEENVIQGGAGSAVNEVIAEAGIKVGILNLGVPDAFIEQDSPAEMRDACGLTEEGIGAAIEKRLS